MFGRPGTLQRSTSSKKQNAQLQLQAKQYRPFHMWAKLFQGPIVLIDQQFNIKQTFTQSQQNKQIVKLIDDSHRILVLYLDGQVDTHFLKFSDGKPLSVQTHFIWDKQKEAWDVFQKLPNNRFCLGCPEGAVEIYSSSDLLFKIKVHPGKITHLFVLRDGNIISVGEQMELLDGIGMYRTHNEVNHIDLETQKITEYKSLKKITSIIELDSGLLMFTQSGSYSISIFDRFAETIRTDIHCMHNPQSLTYLDNRLVYWDGQKFCILEHDTRRLNWIPKASFYHHGEQHKNREVTIYKVDQDCVLTVSSDGIVNATDVLTCRCYLKYESKSTEIKRQVDLGPRPPELEVQEGRYVIGLARAWGVQTMIDKGPLMVIHGVHTTKEDKQWIVENRLQCLQNFLIRDLLQIVVDYWM